MGRTPREASDIDGSLQQFRITRLERQIGVSIGCKLCITTTQRHFGQQHLKNHLPDRGAAITVANTRRRVGGRFGGGLCLNRFFLTYRPFFGDRQFFCCQHRRRGGQGEGPVRRAFRRQATGLASPVLRRAGAFSA